MALRQPIVTIMGHVDHGKTTLLDRIAGSVKASKEAGGITQHIGAMEVPLTTVETLCQGLIRADQFSIPGLLFVDTPGHRSFSGMRRRGGALADIAIVVIDVNEGVMPQTREVMQILRHEKTPFVVAANKSDTISGFRAPPPKTSMAQAIAAMPESTQATLDKKLYALSESLFQLGFSADRYDRLSDYAHNVAIVPVSAKTGAGVPDLLALLVGLSQKFLEAELKMDTTGGEATILERTEERGVGAVANIVLYKGHIKVGDTIVVNGLDKPFTTRVRGLYRPNAVRQGSGRQAPKLQSIPSASAASGIQLAAPEVDRALPGGILKVAGTPEEVMTIERELEREANPLLEVVDNGVWLKADTLGGLEALVYECQEAKIPVKGAEVGAVNNRDIAVMKVVKDPLVRAILAFGVPVLEEAESIIPSSGVKVLRGEVMYRLLEEYGAWKTERGQEVDEERRKATIHPAKVQVMPGHIFRSSKPAIVGVKVLAGDLRPPVRLMQKDGSDVGLLRGLQDNNKSVKEATEGMEVAASIDGAVVGRSLAEGDVLYVTLNEEAARSLRKAPLRPSEKATLEEIVKIHRVRSPFWGA